MVQAHKVSIAKDETMTPLNIRITHPFGIVDCGIPF